MKNIIAASAIVLALTTAGHAGGVAEPVIAPVIIAEDTSSSSDGLLVPILALILIGIAISGGGAAPL